MRERSVLKTMEDLKTILQYLYLDESHIIQVENIIQVPFELSMDDQGNLLGQNLNFPELPKTNWNEALTVPNIRDMVSQLKEQKAVQFPDSYPNRWEEIKGIVSIQMAVHH